MSKNSFSWIRLPQLKEEKESCTEKRDGESRVVRKVEGKRLSKDRKWKRKFV